VTVRQRTERARVVHVYLWAKCTVCGSSATWPASPGYELKLKREERRRWVAAHRVKGHSKTDGIL
jgi:hypothetical protein